MEKKTKGRKHPVSIMIRGIYRPDGDDALIYKKAYLFRNFTDTEKI